MAARALKPRQPWTKAQMIAAGGILAYTGHQTRKAIKKRKEDEKNAFFDAFSDEMSKMAMPLAKARALKLALAGMSMGVVGGITEGVVSPLTSAVLEQRKKGKKKKGRKETS